MKHLFAPALLLLLGFTPTSSAQHAQRALHASELAARVHVVDGVATTRLQLTIQNDGARQREATWVLPLLDGSVADDFRMIVNGVEMRGEVLDAKRARGVLCAA